MYFEAFGVSGQSIRSETSDAGIDIRKNIYLFSLFVVTSSASVCI